MILEVALPAVPTFEPAATPNQRGTAAAHPKVTNPLRSPVPHPIAAEPTIAAPRPLPSRFDLHLEAVNRIDPHPPHANTRQVQTNRHNIRHRGLPGPENLVTHRFQQGLTPIPRIPPHPTHDFAQGREVPIRGELLCSRVVFPPPRVGAFSGLEEGVVHLAGVGQYLVQSAVLGRGALRREPQRRHLGGHGLIIVGGCDTSRRCGHSRILRAWME